MELNLFCKAFDELSSSELYEILQLRAAVFIVEQDCAYQDLDGLDRQAHHIFLIGKTGIQAYTRLLPLGTSYANYASIGRVLTSQRSRKEGLGKKIMNESLIICEKIFGQIPLKISAQQYLIKFYNELGFKEIGEGYLEDDIPHIAMVYSWP